MGSSISTHPERKHEAPAHLACCAVSPLEKVRIPVLVVHHEKDGCSYCPFAAVPQVLDKLGNSPRKQLIAISGGQDRGDPCDAHGYHGFNGVEQSTIEQIASWLLATK